MPARAPTNDIGRRLHRWRVRLNLTLVKVATLLDVTPMTVWRWENGRVEPQDRQRYRITQLMSGGRE